VIGINILGGEVIPFLEEFIESFFATKDKQSFGQLLQYS
jgi:hypothetical protein